ncbi:hypothetical protein GCM10027299_34550 [Larkinella ripae]
MSIYTNILWLSDIHFRVKYSEIDNLKEYFESFIDTVEEYHKIKPIHWIIVSGDLAYSGSVEEYEALFNMLLQPLLVRLSFDLSSPNLITIPGNHDVRWDDINLDFYLSKETDFFERFTKKNNQLSSSNVNAKKFKNIFRDYSNFFRKFSFGSDFILSSDYSLERLYGYLIDKSSKIIFVLVNSAWFSFGSKAEDILEANIVDKSDDWVKKARAVLTEFGGQIVGRNIFPQQDLFRFINENPDYLVITVMHHPLHWLEWGEMYNYSGSGASSLFLPHLLSETDIFLTGHEHVPDYIKANLLNEGNTTHFQAGMFLEDNVNQKDADSQFPHNRFSILQISNNDCCVSEYRYKYNHSEKWKCKPPVKHTLSSELNSYKRKSSLNEEIKFAKLHISDIYIVTNYLNRFQFAVGAANANEHFTNRDGYQIIIQFPVNESMIIGIIMKSYDQFSQFLSSTNFIDNIWKTCKGHYAEGNLSFNIICLDLYASSNSEALYLDERLERGEILNSIVEDVDLKFNKFKHLFFSRYDSDDEDPNWIKFDFVKDAALNMTIIPYWTLRS